MCSRRHEALRVLSRRDPDSDHVNVSDQDALLDVSYGVGRVFHDGELFDDDGDEGGCCGYGGYYGWFVMGRGKEVMLLFASLR